MMGLLDGIHIQFWGVMGVGIYNLRPFLYIRHRLSVARIRSEVHFCTEDTWQLPTAVPPVPRRAQKLRMYTQRVHSTGLSMQASITNVLQLSERARITAHHRQM